MRLKIFYGWWIVFACFFLSFCTGSAIFYGFTVFFEPLVKEFGWNYTQVSFASSLRGLEMGILSPLIGFLVDRFGSRKLLLSGTITVGIGLILLSYTQSLLMFYGAMVFIAFGAGGCNTVVTLTAVAQWFRKNIGKALAITTSGFGASGLAIPCIVWMVDAYGWRMALIILGLGMWILGIPLALIVRDSPEQYGCLPDGVYPPMNQSSGVTLRTIPPMKIGEVLKKRSLLCLNLAEAIRLMVLASVVIHIMPHLSSIDMPRSTAGLIAAAIPLVSIIGRFAFGWLGDVFDKRFVTSLAFCFMAFGTFALAFVNTKLWLCLFLLSFPAGFGGISALRGAIIREYYGINSFGIMMGIMMGFGALGGIIGPTLTGWAFDNFGNYQPVWIGFSALLLLAIVLILKIRPHTHHVGEATR